MTFARILLAGLGLATSFACIGLAMSPSAARAHPLGNFTINHSTTIELSDRGVLVSRVLELAEIPAFQVLQDAKTAPDGTILLDSWKQEQVELLRTSMTLSVDGNPVGLTAGESSVMIREGDGGLQLIRLEASFQGALPDGWESGQSAIAFEDRAYADRIGWREVIARGGPGVELVGSSLPTASPTQRLASYPKGDLSSPPDVRAASFGFKAGVGAPPPPVEVDPDHETATRGNPDRTLGRFTDLITEDNLSAPFIALALLTAMAFGAIHALSPGHGKTIVAAYLVGSRGTMRQAALLGLTVTVTHTSSVYALGFTTLYLSRYIVPEDLYPWMGVTSGAIILIMGLTLLVSRLRASGVVGSVMLRLRTLSPQRTGLTLASDQGSFAMWPQHQHGSTWHDHTAHPSETVDHHHHVELGDEHVHDHEVDAGHKHGWGQAHSHAIPGADGEPVTWQRLLGLGVFGGMIPCPSAIVVMLSAIALHRVGFGLVLILAFSVGLAAVLTGIGFAVVWAQRIPYLQRAMDRAEQSSGLIAVVVRGLPIVAAVLVTLAGIVITYRAAGQF